MKKTLLFLLMVLILKMNAQTDLHCATDLMMKKIFKEHPEIKARLDQHETMHNKQSKSMVASYTIPIVFHILHLGGNENISDNQVRDALNILNRDYAKRNADTSEIIPSFRTVADSTGIQFALATKDPNGVCTNGIIHHYDPDTDWNDTSPTLYSYTWDPTMYLNVYIVRTITLSSGFGAAGYTFFPGTFAPGSPIDAIVVLNNYFGSVGTSSVFQSRVLTHEIGHWLNLLHVFGYNSAAVDCTGDDFVNDTPTTPGYLSCPDAGNPASYQLCSLGVDENYQNYMDYSYCNMMFTHDQGQRMRDALNDNIALRTNLWTTTNLINTGVINPNTTCVPVADFNYNRASTCAGVPLVFTDASWNGQPTTYNWVFPSGNPASSGSPSPVVTYSTPGTYSATLTVSNAAGTSAPITKTNIITVVNNSATYQSIWSEGFENAPLPNADWTLESSSGGSNWEQTFDAAYTGFYSAVLPAPDNTRLSITSMISPTVNLSTFSHPALAFEVAAKEINPAHINRLQVLISTDCEQTWTEIYNKISPLLVTTSDTTNPFIPSSQSQWRFENIILDAFATAASAQFKFVYSRDTISTPSNIYIDDINIMSTTSIDDVNAPAFITLFPNPSEGETMLAISVSEKCTAKISVTDMLGRDILPAQEHLLIQGSYQFAIGDKERLKPGVYSVHIIAGKEVVDKKLVVK